MKKKNISTTPHGKKATLEAFFNYFELSSVLFDANKGLPWNVADIKDQKFYIEAQMMAKELGINWDGMSHEDSNRVMLAMLEYNFNRIKEMEQSREIIINLTIK